MLVKYYTKNMKLLMLKVSILIKKRDVHYWRCFNFRAIILVMRYIVVMSRYHYSNEELRISVFLVGIFGDTLPIKCLPNNESVRCPIFISLNRHQWQIDHHCRRVEAFNKALYASKLTLAAYKSSQAISVPLDKHSKQLYDEA